MESKSIVLEVFGNPIVPIPWIHFHYHAVVVSHERCTFPQVAQKLKSSPALLCLRCVDASHRCRPCSQGEGARGVQMHPPGRRKNFFLGIFIEMRQKLGEFVEVHARR